MKERIKVEIRCLGALNTSKRSDGLTVGNVAQYVRSFEHTVSVIQGNNL
jgi:hypothetical protein